MFIAHVTGYKHLRDYERSIESNKELWQLKAKLELTAVLKMIIEQ